jgi:hypothetical protein
VVEEEVGAEDDEDEGLLAATSSFRTTLRRLPSDSSRVLDDDDDAEDDERLSRSVTRSSSRLVGDTSFSPPFPDDDDDAEVWSAPSGVVRRRLARSPAASSFVDRPAPPALLPLPLLLEPPDSRTSLSLRRLRDLSLLPLMDSSDGSRLILEASSPVVPPLLRGVLRLGSPLSRGEGASFSFSSFFTATRPDRVVGAAATAARLLLAVRENINFHIFILILFFQ